jgi:hypothetical protein
LYKKYLYLTAAGVGLFLLLKSKKKGMFKELIKENNLLISVNNDKTPNLIIIIGGILYATPEFMYKQLTKNIIDNNLIFIAPYNYNFQKLQDEIKNFCNKKQITIKKTSLIGFSAGGHTVQKNYNKNFLFVGLIDPSTAPEYLTQPFSNNVFLMYNANNWGGYPNIKQTLPLLDKKVIDSGGKTTATLLGHSTQPKAFFVMYEKKLM